MKRTQKDERLFISSATSIYKVSTKLPPILFRAHTDAQIPHAMCNSVKLCAGPHTRYLSPGYYYIINSALFKLNAIL